MGFEQVVERLGRADGDSFIFIVQSGIDATNMAICYMLPKSSRSPSDSGVDR